ncbi:MAG: GGDEF domain-containing protein [Bacillota bacterium]
MRDPELIISLTTYYMAGAFMMFAMMVILQRFHKRDYLLTWAISWACLLVGYLMLYYGYHFDAGGFIAVYGLFTLTSTFLQQRGGFMFIRVEYPRFRLYAFAVMLIVYLAVMLFTDDLRFGLFSVFVFSGLLYLDMGRVFLKPQKRPFTIYGAILIAYAGLIAIYPALVLYTNHQGLIDMFFIIFGMAVAYGMVAMHLMDVFKEEEHLQERLYYLSFHDHMTGLRNRAYLESFLNTLDSNKEVNAAILMGDLDTLKVINDKYGHASGDAMIIRAGEILKGLTHEADLLVRYGGDEFVAVLANRDEEAMKTMVHHIKNRTEKETVMDIPLSMSIGYAVHSQGRSIYETLRQAEKRMYEHKRRSPHYRNTQ